MASLTNEDRQALLSALRFDAGRADTLDTPDPRLIFPVTEHIRAVEPDVSLIVGDRGTGKTRLVYSLADERVCEALVRRSKGIRLPQGTIGWRTGWPLGKNGPDTGAWQMFATDRRQEDFVGVWFAYLLRALREDLKPKSAASLRTLLDARGLDASACFTAYREKALEATAALDDLDMWLTQRGEWLYVSYDEIDTVVMSDWRALGFLVRGLVSLWAAYARRWRRIRPKIFLRSDFYRHHREIAGADVAKLAASRVELQWSDKSLYGALIQHIINKRSPGARRGDEPLFRHFSRVVAVDDDSVLGHVPLLSTAREAKPFVDRLVSEFMGKDRRKGLAFTWLLDHLRDGNGRATPRTLVWLIEFAAEIEQAQPRAVGSHLLSHVSLRNALDRVSKEHVENAKTHEFRWLAGLGERLKRDRGVPWPKRDLLRLLAFEFEKEWGTGGSDIRPPGQDPEELLESLVELGIMRARSDGDFDVPDLYLDGLELKRKGGVARR